MAERPELAGRVAWSYLATVLAAAVGGLVALVAYQVVNPLACSVPSDEFAEQALSCSLVWGMGLWVIGFSGALLGALAVLKVDNRLACWLAMVAGTLGLLIGVGQIGQWWWWVAALLLPAAAALASAPWSDDPRIRRLQSVALAVLLAGLVAVFAVQVAAS
ncbi:MAG: hypothetical protein REI45_15395 [Propionicimonas sp.]|nr:hypothetical protein [Propionicimonas sp.]